MIKPYPLLLAVGLACLPIAPARGQFQPKGQFFANGYLTGEVEKPQRRKEFPLTPAQLERLAKATERADKGMGTSYEQLRDSQGPDHEKANETMKANRKDAAAEYEKVLAEVLTPEQLKRLRQITLQRRGPFAFRERAVRDELKLTDEQRAKLDTIFKEWNQEMRAISRFMKDPAKRDEAFETVRRHEETLSEKAAAVLDDGQKRAWKDLLGDPAP